MEVSEIQTAAPGLHPSYFFVIFPLFWMSICGLISILSGWLDFSRRHGNRTREEGQKFHMVSSSIGWPWMAASYRGVLKVTVNEAGLGLNVLFLFAFLHPRLFIPWSAITSMNPRRFLYLQGTRIHLRGYSRSITLWGPPGMAAQEAYDQWKAGLSKSIP